ncbi:hypothetical protein GcM3_065034 [Golovinomyces cichoracearum]|uniref:Uncharacterized protein n=1 Tax=Golovinomyces cichoracearum TaxID=62708 RepID=A0A420IUL5_9PEZI|nr:hypothetical protein GcM3_065034 [Golovinomyces cichoracearum]
MPYRAAIAIEILHFLLHWTKPTWRYGMKKRPQAYDTTIHDCFQHCAIRTPSSNARIITEEIIEEIALIQELNQQIRQLAFSKPIDINFLLNHPSENETFIPSTDEKLFKNLMGIKRCIFHWKRWMATKSPRKYLLLRPLSFWTCLNYLFFKMIIREKT